jgi:hypothetical protein
MFLKSSAVSRGPLEREDLAPLLRGDDEFRDRLAKLMELSTSIEGRGTGGIPFPSIISTPNTPSEKEANWDQSGRLRFRRSNYLSGSPG